MNTFCRLLLWSSVAAVLLSAEPLKVAGKYGSNKKLRSSLASRGIAVQAEGKASRVVLHIDESACNFGRDCCFDAWIEEDGVAVWGTHVKHQFWILCGRSTDRLADRIRREYLLKRYTVVKEPEKRVMRRVQ